jgi:7-cyano-7-deazaguanine reductase
MSDPHDQPASFTPAHLGRISSDPVAEIDRIPWHGSRITVSLSCTEFTSLCPVTHQPDFGELEITYSPKAYLAETKSVKLYLTQFRDQGVFNEVLIDTIAGDLDRQLAPHWIEVVGTFKSRGGISIRVTARREA